MTWRMKLLKPGRSLSRWPHFSNQPRERKRFSSTEPQVVTRYVTVFLDEQTLFAADGETRQKDWQAILDPGRSLFSGAIACLRRLCRL